MQIASSILSPPSPLFGARLFQSGPLVACLCGQVFTGASVQPTMWVLLGRVHGPPEFCRTAWLLPTPRRPAFCYHPFPSLVNNSELSNRPVSALFSDLQKAVLTFPSGDQFGVAADLKTFTQEVPRSSKKLAGGVTPNPSMLKRSSLGVVITTTGAPRA